MRKDIVENNGDFVAKQLRSSWQFHDSSTTCKNGRPAKSLRERGSQEKPSWAHIRPWQAERVCTWLHLLKNNQSEIGTAFKEFPKQHADPSAKDNSLSGSRGFNTTSNQILTGQYDTPNQGHCLGSQA